MTKQDDAQQRGMAGLKPLNGKTTMNKTEQRNWDLSGIQIEAAVNYLVKKGALPSRRSAPKVIGRELPCCPPMEEPLWEHHHQKFGFTPPDRLVRWVWVA